MIFLFAGLATASVAAAAESAAPNKLGLCMACHGSHGISSLPGHPHLAGQDYTYLRQSLEKYRTGERQHAAMQAALGPLGADDLEKLARYYADLPRDGVPKGVEE